MSQAASGFWMPTTIAIHRNGPAVPLGVFGSTMRRRGEATPTPHGNQVVIDLYKALLRSLITRTSSLPPLVSNHELGTINSHKYHYLLINLELALYH